MTVIMIVMIILACCVLAPCAVLALFIKAENEKHKPSPGAAELWDDVA